MYINVTAQFSQGEPELVLLHNSEKTNVRKLQEKRLEVVNLIRSTKSSSIKVRALVRT